MKETNGSHLDSMTEDTAPATDVQRWFHFKDHTPGHTVINLLARGEIVGDSGDTRFRAALEKVCDEEPGLRTVFVDQADLGLQQVVLKNVSPEVHEYDLRTIPMVDQQAEFRLLVTAARQRRFVLHECPPWSAVLVRMSDQRWQWRLALHHILADHYSTLHLQTRLEDLLAGSAEDHQLDYLALRVGRGQHGSPSSLTDLGRWEASPAGRAVMARNLDVWQALLIRSRVPGGRDLWDLMCRTPDSSMLQLSITPEETAAWSAAAQKRRVTLATLVLFGFAAALRVRSVQDEILIRGIVASPVGLRLAHAVSCSSQHVYYPILLTESTSLDKAVEQAWNSGLRALKYSWYSRRALYEWLDARSPAQPGLDQVDGVFEYKQVGPSPDSGNRSETTAAAALVPFSLRCFDTPAPSGRILRMTLTATHEIGMPSALERVIDDIRVAIDQLGKSPGLKIEDFRRVRNHDIGQ